ncbi:MAG: hypothetical protein LBL52_02370 [Rickettsiales bacterium]|jgi:hypothetical protein|nr:hypothetical protein [Rickettsiales bacterium]
MKKAIFAFLLFIGVAARAEKLMVPVRLANPSPGVNFRAGGVKDGAGAPVAPASRREAVKEAAPVKPAEPELEYEDLPAVISDMSHIKPMPMPTVEPLPTAPKPEGIAVPRHEEAAAPKPIKPSPAPSAKSVSPVILKFAAAVEELDESQVKSLAAFAEKAKALPEYTIKAIAYYTKEGGRNASFARLLNARKALMDRDVPASSIMILTLEDEAGKSDNTVEFSIVE